MSEAQELDSPIAKSENNENSTLEEEEQISRKTTNGESPKLSKSESIEEPRKCEEKKEERETLPNENSRMEKSDENSVVTAPTSPTTKTLDRNKAGECNLLPVLVEQLRSALEQSCSSQSSSEEQSLQPEDSGVDSEEDLRVWASGLCNSMDQQQQRFDDTQSPRGLKLDLKFLEDLLLSDIQTALGRLQETLKRVDIGTLTRYSSTRDPTNKLNLLKLISSLLANLKIPEDAKPEKTAKSQSVVARRRRTDRHTIGVSSEELARARKWLEDKNSSPGIVEPTLDPPLPQLETPPERIKESYSGREDKSNLPQENLIERLDSQSLDKQYDKVPEKYMKDAINQQQSLQNKSVKDTSRENSYHEQPGKSLAAPKLMDTSYKDDNTIINEEYGISASSLYHQSNAQAKCNKFLAKKSKIKRANTIDIPNYLKLQAESLANGYGGSLRRPINIGDKYSHSGGNVIPSFEPKTENDRKFLALISKNNETTTVPPPTSLPFKSFNYRQIATVADKNWNSRFSNIKTTFDKPRTNSQDENAPSRSTNEARRKSHCDEIVVGSLRLPYNTNKQKSAFSHAPTSPFQKIEKPNKEEITPGFLKPGYLSKNGSMLQAKVKMFDVENGNASAPLSPLPVRSRAKQFNVKRGSNVFADANEQNSSVDNTSGKSRVTENGHLNYHSFCKQFAPFATKNPDNHKSNPWSNCSVSNATSKSNLDKRAREKFETREKSLSQFGHDVNKPDVKVPVAYQTGERYEKNERNEKSRHRKLYDTYDGPIDTEGTNNCRDIVAYPFEINYHKRPTFGKKIRDVPSEKDDYDDPEEVRRRPRSPPPPTSLQYIKSVLPSVRNPSPPPRGAFSMQSVAVQTQQNESGRSNYPNEIPRRLAPPPPTSPPPLSSSQNVAALQTRNLPNEQSRRTDINFEDARIAPRHYSDSYQQPSFQCDDSQFTAHQANYPGQGRQVLPQNTHGSRPSNYPLSTDYKNQYYPSVEHDSYSTQNSLGQAPPQIPVRANPPNKAISSILKNQQINQDENFDRCENNPYEDFDTQERVHNYPDYGQTIFYRDNQNPIYVPPAQNLERDKPSEDPSQILPQPIPYSSVDVSNNPEDTRSYDDIESADMSEDHSFADDENIANQDISSTEGVVTRYTCAIATVSPVPESPILSPLPPTLKETQGMRIFDENLPSNQQVRELEIPSVPAPISREERARENDGLSLDQIRRHNLLQQNLIRQLQGDQSTVPNVLRRLSQEALGRDEITSASQLPNYPIKYPDEQEIAINEPVIENNNTQDKINIFESRNNSTRKHQQQFKPLSIPRNDRDAFVMPKINIVSPSKVFKPSFNVDASRSTTTGTAKLPRKPQQCTVDSSDEYLMSCANKPSRSIVLSKSESWHQLAMSKSTLQVPQSKPNSLLKPPKPKSPSSLRLNKQYEASSSSDTIRKMEEKIQRYFQGPTSSGQPDSPVATRRDPKTKRNFNSRKNPQGPLMRSHTMPHIYDETTDVEKAFDSLFKEATRVDKRY